MSEIISVQDQPIRSGLISPKQDTAETAQLREQRFSDVLANSQVEPDPELVAAEQNDNEEIEDRFLALLIAQMRNQDPLNPLENAEVTTQMAQINSASGIASINTQIGKLLAQSDGANPVASANVLGRDVLVASDMLQLDDPGAADAIGGVRIPALVSDATVEVIGDSGQVIRRISLGQQPAGIATFGWDGLTNAGELADPGNYRFRVISGNADSTPLQGLSLSRVVGVTRGDESVELQLRGGTEVSADDVFGIYQ